MVSALCEESMKATRLIFAIFILVLIIVSESNAGETEKKKSCKEHLMLSGPCFKIRGRMSLYNGTLNIRIWPVGTNRMLGIGEGKFLLNDYENLPKDLEQQLNRENAMFADFTVDKPGHMRQVCVESAENMTIREW